MSFQIEADREATNHPITLQINKNGGVTGLSPLVAIRDGATTDSYLDFADLTFKTSGWTTRQAALAEVSQTNAPGLYGLSGGLSIVGITNLPNATTTRHLIAEYDVPSGAVRGNAIDIILLSDLPSIARYLGVERGTPSVHTPSSISAGPLTQTVAVVGSTVTKTRTD